ncbi:MAG: PDDEXK nuclease domain-containing protein [Phocaeicola sp.]
MEQSQITPSTYNQAAEVIKTAILQGQYEALKDENRVQLSVYFGVGKYVSVNSRKGGTWGTGALESISERLRKILPGLRGFSANSLKNMRKFYEQWSMLDNSTITNVETTNGNSTIAIVELPDAIESIDIYHTLTFSDTVSFPVEDFLHTPFTHHIRIIEKIESIDERYYYIRRCANEYLSVEALKRLFKDDAYHNQQQIPNNFATAKISAKEARKAVMMFKDEYALDFINVEEIGERDSEDIDERAVEQQIVQNIKRFIMTFGNDFAFIGNQYHLEVYGVEHFPDLLFFNRELNAMVCVELKVGAFKPSYLGQLTAYLRILDDHVKKPHENPSIGIVLCKSAKREYVEYIIQDYDKPMGVATYITSADMPENLRKALPDMDELKNLL